MLDLEKIKRILSVLEMLQETPPVLEDLAQTLAWAEKRLP